MNEDGNVISMECEIPEVVVFLKESDSKAFKDICIDEVPFQDKCSIDDCELDHNNIANLLKYELAKSGKEVSEEVMLYISTEEDPFSNHDCIKDDLKQSGAGNKLMEEDKADSGATDDIVDAYSSNDNLSEGPNFTSEPISKSACPQLDNSTELSHEQKKDQNPTKEAVQGNSSFSNKESYSNDYKVHTLLSLMEKSMENAEVEQPSKDDSMDNNADFISKSSVAPLSHQSTEDLPEHGSASSPPPSHRYTFSGSAYSDSISLRSTSTASARSFAFPILATEGNESPVRMAPAHRRRLKKPRCWRMCFSCC